MGQDELRLYRALSRAPFPKSYLGKVFLMAFLGTHVPLLALITYLVRFRRFGAGASLRILSITVPATLGGMAGTLLAIDALHAPVTLASRALRRYLDSGETPELPAGYTDRAGRLMADVQYAVERLDAAMGSLGELAATDHLTGLLNRRAAEGRLAEDVARAERGGGTLTLALLDLDRFKDVNDEHGHRAGDVCLAHLAEVLGGDVRGGDWVARWGGTSSWWASGTRRGTSPRRSGCWGALPRSCARTRWSCPTAGWRSSHSEGEWAGGNQGTTRGRCSPRRTMPSGGRRSRARAP